MTALLPQVLINGLIVGAIYGLLGLSLTIVYGAMRVANLAHGDLVVAGSFIAFVMTTQQGQSPMLSMLVAFIGVAAIGGLIYSLALRRLQNSPEPEIASFLFFYGVSLMTGAALLFIFGADTRSVLFQFDPISFRFADVIVSHARILALAIGIAIVAGIFFVLYRTIYGKALRAAIMNREALLVVGVNIDRLSLVAFAVSFGVIGLTGVLIGLVFPAFHPFSGLEFTIIAFIVVVLGGLGHPVGAVVGGIIFGLCEQVTALYLGQSLGMIVGFLVLIVIILIKPDGLFGRASWNA